MRSPRIDDVELEKASASHSPLLIRDRRTWAAFSDAVVWMRVVPDRDVDEVGIPCSLRRNYETRLGMSESL